MTGDGARVAANIRAGRGYITAGWPVFILSPGKSPVSLCDPCRAEHVRPEQMEACACLCCHGFYAATTDPERATAMARRHPRGLLAVRTGAPSGTVVLDVDQASGGIGTMRSLIRDGLLPRTVTQRTGGGGYHLLYRYPGGRIPSRGNGAGQGIDVKADGGYIVVAPSIHPRTGRAYHWISPFSDPPAELPESWIRKLTPPVSSPPRPRATRMAEPGAYGAAVLDRETAALQAVTANRNDALNATAFRLFRLVAGGVLDEETVTARLWQAAAANGLAGEEPGAVRRTIASGRRGGLQMPRGPGQRVA